MALSTRSGLEAISVGCARPRRRVFMGYLDISRSCYRISTNVLFVPHFKFPLVSDHHLYQTSNPLLDLLFV